MYRPIHYYLKNEEGVKVGTVCIVPYKNDFSRGISLCADIDTFNRGVGKAYAIDRAIKGLVILSNFEKPLSNKQVRLARAKKKYIRLNPIRKKYWPCEIWPSDSFRVVYERLQEIMGEDKTLYKIETFTESGLSSYERRLLERNKKEETS